MFKPASKPISNITSNSTAKASLTNFLKALSHSSTFQGEIGESTDNIVQAVDNSIYEYPPEAVIYPKTEQDIQQLFILANLKEYSSPKKLHFTVRGGGTGTNAQSLTDGILIDVSRHMNAILHFDPKQQEISVQPGVTLEQLNSYLKPHGYFFPPNVSSGSRATIGGMVSTDASGMGSRVYGKTSNWIKDISSVLTDGTLHTFKSQPIEEYNIDKLSTNHPNPILHNIYQQIHHTLTHYRQSIESTFPKMNRGLTGYNLHHSLQYLDAQQPKKPTHINPCYLIAGSEGTLCTISQITCKVRPIPKYKAVAAVLYENLSQAISAISPLIKANPSAIEFINDGILNIAQKDECWQDIAPLIQHDTQSNKTLGGINFVELVADDEATLKQNINALEQCLKEAHNTPYAPISWHIANSHQAVTEVWAFRAKAQGLIASPEGRKRSIAFIEDAAVPIETLPTFIEKLQALFTKHNIKANLYGHADVGCVHVRPNLDLSNPEEKALIRQLSDEVFTITKNLGGLIWGEHGKGVRSEYNPQIFGKTLYQQLQKIKSAFDPHNQLNPAKVATPYHLPATLFTLESIPLRADTDKHLLPHYETDYAQALYCNGNGSCYNWDENQPMCPSYKTTRDKRHSPKGRAMLLREWLRKSLQEKASHQHQFSKEILPIMNNCFGCSACTHHCPLHVNIPDLRAKYLNHHYQHHRRPLKDYLIAHIENITPKLASNATLARTINTLQHNTLGKKIIQHLLGMVDTPSYSLPTLKQQLAQLDKQNHQNDAQPHNSLILIADCFNRYYDNKVVIAALKLFHQLGLKVTLAPDINSGKAQHIKGFLKQYKKTTRITRDKLHALAQQGNTLIGLDSSVSITYQQEYIKQFGKAMPKVHLLHEWLANYLNNLNKTQQQHLSKTISSASNPSANNPHSSTYQLLLHCSENTAAPHTAEQWKGIFQHLKLTLETKKLGCCGMAGSFGHEKSNLSSSQQAYELSWKKHIETNNSLATPPTNSSTTPSTTLLATGYSCRSQVQRLSNKRLPHPVEILAQHLITPH